MDSLVAFLSRPGATHLQLRREPIEACEYTAMVELCGQRVKLMDSRWRVENGFVRVAACPGPSSFLFEVGWMRASDMIIQMGNLRFRELTDDGWFRARWALTSDQFVIVVNDAPPCSHDEFAESFASLGHTEGATVARFADAGHTYCSLQVVWPTCGDMTTCSKIHVTLGYLARMEAAERDALRRRLTACLQAWCELAPMERPMDDRIFHARSWRFRPRDVDPLHFPHVHDRRSLAVFSPARVDSCLADGRIYDPWISESDEEGFRTKVRNLVDRDRDRLHDAFQRAERLQDPTGTMILAHKEVIEEDGFVFNIIDEAFSAELRDLLQYLCDHCHYCKAGQHQYHNAAGQIRSKPPVTSQKTTWHCSKFSWWTKEVDDYHWM